MIKKLLGIYYILQDTNKIQRRIGYLPKYLDMFSSNVKQTKKIKNHYLSKSESDIILNLDQNKMIINI